MIDWNRISELKGEIGDDGFAEVIDLFFDDVDDAMTALRSATGTGTFGEALHFLKGSAQNLGLSDVSALCEREEARLSRDRKASPDIETIALALVTARRELLRD